MSGLNGDEDIDVLYNEFENSKKHEEILAFAKAEDLEVDMIEEFIAKYEFTNVINPGDIRDRITISMPLLEKKALVNRIMAYMKLIVEKYSN